MREKDHWRLKKCYHVPGDTVDVLVNMQLGETSQYETHTDREDMS